ncbi:hypothetical protein QR680_010426 [Steinernema hermaphroditum]|uniref:BTB domain-containing protein n=1 Tax=Steinernema hermaphroditum TaxID=289476 RepID=A0AA39MAN6_9BILA|nr:hypothetical protein QR680_010426 [Steinernema hermaphroditum]
MPVKIVWDFKKSAHFEENYSESPMHRIGYFDWTLFIDDETLRVRCVPHASDSFGLVHEVEAFGTVILKGVDVRDDEEYDWNVITAGNITIATYANFGLDSFDRKFLHPGGIYRIETTIHITRGYCVDFCSPNNPFIGERSNAVRIVVEGHGFYVSKSHLGTMIPYFKARFRYDAQTVDDEGIALEGVDAETFCEFLKMLYPLKAHENCFFGCIRDVLIFADRMCCDIVLQRSQEILMRRKFFDVETLELADMYNLEQLRSVALQEMPRRELERYRKKYGGRPECERTLKLLGKELEARDAKRFDCL